MQRLTERPLPGLEVSSQPHGTSVTITAAGEIDLAIGDHLDAALSAALRDSPEFVVIDLSAVTFVDSTGIHLLFAAYRRATARGIRLAIIPGPEHVQRPFALCGLLDELPFVALRA